MQQSNITQLHGVNPLEFKEIILADVRTELQALSQNFQPVTQPEYITRKELAEILKVTLVTIIDWDKKGVLKPYRLGNLIRYKRSEIEQSLIAINPKK